MATRAQAESLPVARAGVPGLGYLSEVWQLYKRALIKLRRRPIILYFTLVQPLIWLLLFGQLFSNITRFQPNLFPGGSYMAFFTPGVMIMTAIFGSGQTGVGLITDMDSGFLDKLLTTPIHRSAILLGRILGDLTRIVGQSAILLLIVFILGVRVATGPLGALVILVIVGLFGLALAGLAAAIALWTRNTEATFIISTFLSLPLMFTSTAMLPKPLLPDWIQTISAFNPVSYGINAARSLMLVGWEWDTILPGILVLGCLAAITVTAATLLFRRRTA